MDDLTSAIRATSNSAPGQNDVHYAMLKFLPPEGMDGLLNVYSQILQPGYFPKQWLRSIIILNLKSAKYTANPSNYRPISLTSFLCKITEKLLT